VVDIVPGSGGTSGPQWVKYVRWDVIRRWREDVQKPADGARCWPYEFGSRDAAFPRIRGGVLWLVTSPRYGTYRMPPSLVARLRVTDVVRDDPAALDVDPHVRRHGPWRALAARDEGAYLPLNNAFAVLRRLRFDGRPDRVPDAAPGSPHGPYVHLPAHLQRHRVLTPASAQLLDEYQAAVRRGRRVFLSYSWADFEADRDWIAALADTLTAHTVSCWWDRWHLPDTDDDGGTGKLLGDLLGDAVRQAVWFVALLRPRYAAGLTDPRGDPPWAVQEWRKAGAEIERHRRDDLQRVAVVFGDLATSAHALRADDLVLRVPADASPRAVAGLLLDLLPG
jgi:hypothetical protein